MNENDVSECKLFHRNHLSFVITNDSAVASKHLGARIDDSIGFPFFVKLDEGREKHHHKQDDGEVDVDDISGLNQICDDSQNATPVEKNQKDIREL